MAEERQVSIEVLTTSAPWSREFTPSDRVIGVNIETVGTAKVYTSWSSKPAVGKGTVNPGTSRSFGLGWPYFISGQRLQVSFDSIGTKKVEITILRDNGPLNC